VERDTSLSELSTQALIEIVEQSDRYNVAKQRHLAQMAQASDLGAQSQIERQRETLHAR